MIGIFVLSLKIYKHIKKSNQIYPFTMVSKDSEGNNAKVPGLILSTEKQVRFKLPKTNFLKKEKDRHEENLIMP
jgi:hypothetical protein